MSILTAHGQPVLAKEIKDRLQEIDPALGLAIVPTGDGRKAWAVTERWPLTDPRRAQVQRGERPEDSAFDILCWLPEDCPPEQAPGYLERSLKRWSGTKAEVHRYLERLHLFNEKQRSEVLKPTMELSEELIHANRRTLFRDIGKTTASTIGHGRKSKKDLLDYRDYLEDLKRSSE